MNILLCTPTLGQVKTGYFTSVLRTVHHVNTLPDIHLEILTVNNQLTQRARNILTHYFMKDKKYTHLFFVDSDIEFSPEDFIKVATSGKPINCALYPNKVYYWTPERCAKGRDFLVNFSARVNTNKMGETDVSSFDKESGLCEIDLVATGFVCIERGVFEKLQDKVETFKYNLNNERMHDYWNCKIIDDEWMTEDYVFSRLARDSGYTLYSDLTVQLTHIGDNGYTSNPMNVLLPNEGMK